MARQTLASLYRSRRPSVGKRMLSHSNILHNVLCMVTYHNLQAEQIDYTIMTGDTLEANLLTRQSINFLGNDSHRVKQ